MEETILEAVKQIRMIYNYYLAMMGLMALWTVIHFQNSVFDFKQENIRIFNFKIHSEYFSLIYGVLFGVFVAILFLQLHLLKSALISVDPGQYKDAVEFAKEIRYFPWIASPFHEAKIGPIIFWSILVIGFLILVSLVRSHVWPKEQFKEISAFARIGYIDLAILIGTLILLGFIIEHISSINRIIEKLESSRIF